MKFLEWVAMKCFCKWCLLTARARTKSLKRITQSRIEMIFARARIAEQAEQIRDLEQDVAYWRRRAGAAASVRAEALDEAHQAVASMIRTGPLPGNGCDEQAQRNGLVLASNAICELMRKP